MTQPQAGSFSVWLDLPIRWSDMDALGHVNNAVFFTFIESGRIDYFHTLGAPTTRSESSEGFILAHAACDYIAQLHYPGSVRVGTRIRALGRSSIHFEQGIWFEDRLVAAAKAICAWFNFEENRTVPVPDGIRAQVRAREKVAPEEQAPARA